MSDAGDGTFVIAGASTIGSYVAAEPDAVLLSHRVREDQRIIPKKPDEDDSWPDDIVALFTRLYGDVRKNKINVATYGPAPANAASELDSTMRCPYEFPFSSTGRPSFQFWKCNESGLARSIEVRVSTGVPALLCADTKHSGRVVSQTLLVIPDTSSPLDFLLSFWIFNDSPSSSQTCRFRAELDEESTAAVNEAGRRVFALEQPAAGRGEFPYKLLPGSKMPIFLGVDTSEMSMGQSKHLLKLRVFVEDDSGGKKEELHSAFDLAIKAVSDLTLRNEMMKNFCAEVAAGKIKI